MHIRRLLVIAVLMVLVASVYVVQSSGLLVEGSEGDVVFRFVDKYYHTNYSDPVVLRVSMKFQNGSGIAGVTVKFYIVVDGDKSLIGWNTTNTTGVAWLVWIPYYEPGTYTINATATYDGADFEDSANMDIGREDTAISMDSIVEVEYTDNVSIEARIVTDDGEPVKNARVCLYVVCGGGMHKADEDVSSADGSLSFTLSTASMGVTVNTYDLIAIFEGNEFYNPSSSKSILNVTNERMVISVSSIGKAVVGSSIIIVVKIVDNDGEPVPFVEVRILINDELVGVGRTDSSGIYKYSWTPESAGRYDIKILAYKENYDDAEYSFVIDVEGEPSGFSFSTIFIIVLMFLIVAVIVALFARRHG